MIRRTTWVILVIFIALVGLAWYLQRTGETASGETTPTAVSQTLFEVEESAISALRVEDAQGNAVALERNAEGLWSLTEPQGEVTDVGLAEQAMSQLATLEVVTTLEEAPALGTVGLASPAHTITVTLEDGRALVAKVGKETSVGSGYYVLVEGKPVQVASKFGLDGVLGLLQNPPILATHIPEVEPTPETTPEPAPTQ
jgi:hypothetical protein